MNYNDVNIATKSALKKESQRNIFAHNFEASGKALASLAISKKEILDTIDTVATGDDDSFLTKSKIFPVLIDHIDLDNISLFDLLTLNQAAVSLETGSTQAYNAFRDTTIGKPIERHEQVKSRNVQELTDEQIEFLLAHSEIDSGPEADAEFEEVIDTPEAEG